MKEQIQRRMPRFDVMPMHSEVADTLRPFLDLTPKQRSTVILRDVLGYSAAEVADLTDTSVSSVKSALHRGRVLLKKFDPEDEAVLAPLPEAARQQLATYARCFNAHEFNRLRDMLADEVRLELVSKENRDGRQAVGNYFGKGGVQGVRASLCRDFDRAAPRGTGDVKAGGNYAADLLPLKIAKAGGFGTTLYLDAAEQKYIEEFSVSNFIGITERGAYVTPASASILPSITNAEPRASRTADGVGGGGVKGGHVAG